MSPKIGTTMGPMGDPHPDAAALAHNNHDVRSILLQYLTLFRPAVPGTRHFGEPRDSNIP